MKKLNQIIAVEKGIKTRTYSTITNVHRTNDKSDLFNGFAKTYRKKDEEGEDFPPEKRNVLHSVIDQLETVKKVIVELFNVTATKDFANCHAKADLVVDGTCIAKDVPATYLLFLEKQMNDLRTFTGNLPILDPAESWTYDINSGQYKTDAITTHKSKKIQKPIILCEPTKEHPAQTQLISEDVVVGYWDTVKYSGAIPVPDRNKIIDRIDTLATAIKEAREKANTVEAKEILIAKSIFDYIFVGQAKN